ncbi:SWIM zinc finger family protein [Streptosporangiaceae bacterium NEAU-GS5]|nr:SWIM zinc finger family protein [Streptosporangiaceae bacterium NEAU-GS5]
MTTESRSHQVTTREIATANGVSIRTAQRWCQQGKLSAVKMAGRWVVTVPVDLTGYSLLQMDKASELIEQGGLVATTRPGVWTAVSSDGTTTYLVMAGTCTCPAGQRGRDCYHRAAVAIVSAARRAA